MGGGPLDQEERLLCILPFDEPKEITARLREKFPKLSISFINMGSMTDEDVYRDKTILATLSALPPNPADCPELELIHVFSAGTNHISKHPIYTDTKITLTTSSGVHGPQIAEWVLMTALVHSHKYNRLYELQKQHQWGRPQVGGDYHSVRDMVDQRLGVLGYGSIGRQVGRVAKAMGMDVVAYTATPKDTPEKKRDNGFIVPGTGDPDGEFPSSWFSGLDKASLHQFLKQDLDYLVISVPLTKETTHLLGKDEFDILKKKQTFLTNISRGAIVDQPALVAALKEGKLRGAALDVADPEPLPSDNPLWSAPNVIITPHISGVGTAYNERAFAILELNLLRKQLGEKLVNVVNRKRGY
ncbi:2-hydroxyacid dehydrogenase [Patellaria atrata CBS 101060]|uniref:2-hydroxyacid dehydrogenase n=1 Tax=Patellaria atrata CBS 101060 TaxID=1346257 RepID=A0A9P4S5C5_9PEZI|nr:2-hydroxyacid dehydrogenase [Patellaria atrata CBS 101060]